MIVSAQRMDELGHWLLPAAQIGWDMEVFEQRVDEPSHRSPSATRNAWRMEVSARREDGPDHRATPTQWRTKTTADQADKSSEHRSVYPNQVEKRARRVLSSRDERVPAGKQRGLAHPW